MADAPTDTPTDTSTDTPIDCTMTTNTTATTMTPTHLIVFVHGWLGNENELSYLRSSMELEAVEHDGDVVFHSAKCNAGRTNDGIHSGGKRLAEEIQEKLEDIEGQVFLSVVGNSLGGLYSRFALSEMDLDDKDVTPFIFCTISTPHLGNHDKDIDTTASTRFKWVLGRIGGSTSQDLFMQTPTIRKLGTEEVYLAPLRKFKKRIALANAYRTDILVSTKTAAFLSSSGPSSSNVHTTMKSITEGKSKNFALALETAPRESSNKEDMSENLDSLGWTKILLDIRDDLPFPSISNPFKKKREEATIPDKSVWTSDELLDVFDQPSVNWKLPLGHQVSSVNSKNSLASRISEGGKPTMDQLGKDLLAMVYEQCSDAAPSFAENEPEHVISLVPGIEASTTLCVGSVTLDEGASQPIVSMQA